MDNNQKKKQLMEAGFQALEDCDFKAAIKIGRKIRRLRNTSAFEILGLAYSQKGKPKKAIKILKKGLRIAPDLWVLWQLLGNLQSDLNNFSEAQTSYEKALQCESTDEDSIRYNSALAYIRENKYIEAQKQIEQVNFKELLRKESYKLLLLASQTNITIFNELNEFKKAYDFGLSLLKDISHVDAFPKELSALYDSFATTMWKLTENNQAFEYLWKSIELDKTNQNAMFLIRELENQFSSEAKSFQLVIEGVMPVSSGHGTEGVGFFTSYNVVAKNPDQAFELAKRFEPKNLHESLRVEEAGVFDDCPNIPVGVYSTTPYIMFALKEEPKSFLGRIFNRFS
ncbi:MAG: tetratricopeptide repeat protein [Desulfatibacillum sp.]|nr:tetratricopeptide repeat protein [Desulfatibacillum sp.]